MPPAFGSAHTHAMPTTDDFASRLLHWFDQHGRHDLPWQHPRSAYRVWLSEVMLQQTQVQTVIPYFQRFVAALPDVHALAAGSIDEVMALWSGLGYYGRARNLHAAARRCVELHDGELPTDFDALLALPGIGRSTAGAILAQAHGLRFPILDGNVKRVLTRWAGIEGWPGASAIEKRLWQLSDALLPPDRLADYTQAVMDLGATVCSRSSPTCLACPLKDDCTALRDGRTAELPTAKPAKILPRRSCSMLVAFDEKHRVLLQRRDGPGVWHGLWSLPEASDSAALDAFARRHLDTQAAALELPSIEHVFSHYRLSISPQRRDNVKLLPQVRDNGPCLRWASLNELTDIGLPAPIRKLLQSLELK
ncbi:A/G-specific adenine glycosylase [Xanthomonadaceae bacterium JHOS43]|nr:A/G-specific adenine glycosylase [Xanthomonadaceae bacterium JHOS43]MCX7562674.1 A/G-specific adenine glycosylase [Xanthomonadaceae bacterium XH05]